MNAVLAQTAPQTAPAIEPASQPATSYLVNWSLWEPTSHELLRSAMLCIGTLVAGLLVLVLLRGWLARVKLPRVMVVATLATASFLAVVGLKPTLAMDAKDPIGYLLPRLFAAVMIFVALRVVDRLIIVPLLSRGGRVTMPRFFHQMVNIVLAFFAALAYGATAFGWDINGFLAGSAVVSIVVGLALQESLGNLVSGLVMHASPPFSIGDWIECGDHEGRVVDMTWRAVTLHTDDENYIIIPNSTIAKADILNYSVPTRATQRPVTVGLDYDIPPHDAVEALKAAALETPGVLADPPPYVFLDKFADSAIEYQMEFSITNAPDHRKIETEVKINVWYRLKERGYNIPFPIRTVEHVSQQRKRKEVEASTWTRRAEILERVPLLSPLNGTQREQLARIASDVVLGTGQTLFRQNDRGDSFYVICKGQVEVIVTPEGTTEERRVATLGLGDFFGEMSALTGQPRTATIRALSPLGLVKIEKRDLLEIFKADPAIMEKVSEIVARRNAERAAILQGPGAKATTETVAQEKKSLLGRMMTFFRLGNAA